MRPLLIAAAFTLGLLFPLVPQAAFGQTIVVEGNRRVDAETIRSYFRTRPGERIDAATIDAALKALYGTGLYEDVRISQSGGRIVVTVVENPTINRVAFEGNKKVKDDALAAEVQSRARAPLSRPTVQADVQRIVEVYRRQGYYNVRVDPKIIDQPNSRVDLVFEINEADRTTIRKIVFVGNRAFSDWKLRDVINTGQTHLLSFLSNRDVYDPDRVNADQELLRRFYLKNGYADFRIISANVEFDPAANGFVLTFTVDEGEQYRFGQIDLISNLRDMDPASLRRLLLTKSGSVYNAEEVEKSIEEITIELAKQGYAFAQVRPRGDRDFANRRINVTFIIEQGSRVYVERINIRGNTRTRDWVIRREFSILEGDPYNRALIDRAERRLRNLGYFKTVRITNEPGSAPDRVIVNVDVDEQLTGEFSIGGGYSTADGLIAEVSIGERNFLGRGQFVRLAGTYGQRSRGAEFSFTEPYFLGYRVAAGFDIYRKQQLQSQYASYDSTITGGTLRSAFPLREDLTFNLRYNVYQRKIKIEPGLQDGCAPSPSTPSGFVEPDGATACTIDNDGVAGAPLVPGDPREASVAFKQLVGSTLTSSMGYGFAYNTLDDIRNPSRGVYAAINQEFAGLGGDTQFIKTTAESRYYHPVTNDLTAMFKVSGGHVSAWGGKQLFVLDHFFQGPAIVRGFEPAGIGPRDLGSQAKDALGGSLYWGATAELQFPIPFLPKEVGIRGALFADAGSLWDYRGTTNFAGLPGVLPPPTPCPAGSTLKGPAATGICLADSGKIRSSVGASIIWASPFGPLRFDFAFPITKEPYDRTQPFRFAGGTAF